MLATLNRGRRKATKKEAVVRFKDMPVAGVQIPKKDENKIMHVSLPIGNDHVLKHSTDKEASMQRSEERRVGKECRSRGARGEEKKKEIKKRETDSDRIHES